MTLAGQYLLLQVLIVLAVLVAVGAISLAQSARSFERSEGRRGAERGREPGRATRRSASGSPRAAARRPARSPSVGRVRRAPCPASDVGAGSPARTARAGLLRPHPGRRTRSPSAPAGCCAGASWTGHPGRRRAATVVAQVPVLRRRTGEVVGLAAIGREVPVGRGAGSATWCPTCWSTSASPACSALGGSLLLSRRVKRQTLGMEPTEIAGLVEHREALRARRQGGRRRPRPAAAGHAGQRQRPPAARSCRADCVGPPARRARRSTRSWSRC